jgi:transcriptional regulator GlxA family with amidase domain
MKRVVLMMVLSSMLAVACGAAERKPYTRNVAIVVYENAEPLDWTGPFEVYNDAARFGAANGNNAFNVYIVSKTSDPLDCQGLHVVPQYSIENAPKPDIVLFPGGPSSKIYEDPAFFAWAKKARRKRRSRSPCAPARSFSQGGMLDGLEVTTHYGSIDGLQRKYPKAQVKRGRGSSTTATS